jgi:hypothetical protein
MATELQLRALRAVADAPDEPGRKLRAVKLLRDADGAERGLREYIAAIDWALAHPAATDLPDGSVVAVGDVVYIKNHPSDWCQWRGTNGSHVTDRQVDEDMPSGVEVLRVGYGEKG